ncbi:MAG: N-acetyltransferase [Pseudolysinimonas sp.]
MTTLIRDYGPTDERSWLLTRLLAFFDTTYFDDVKTKKTVLSAPSIEMVATELDRMTGLLDIEIDGHAATIDSIAVHPGAQRSGTGRRLLDEGLRRLSPDVHTLDAWTRDDEGANSWYRTMGFQERQRYLHVYRADEAADPEDGFTTPDGLSLPVIAFMHAPIEREAEMRAKFARVHVCRQYVMQLGE